ATHFLGRVLVEQAAESMDGELVWRTIRRGQRHLVEHAHADFRQAGMARHAGSDRLALGHDWRRDAEALWLLHEVKDARHAERKAQELLQHGPAAANLYLSQGRFALSNGNDARGQDLLHQAAHLAWLHSSPIVLSAALGGLAELYAIGHRSWQRRLALDCCLAALIAWPFTRTAKDFRRFVRLGQALLELADLQGKPARHLVEPDQFPFDLISPRLLFDEARLRQMDDLLSTPP
ncbi:MAG: hypothetical protein ACRDI2_21995, partial [Chloroflexota bacterium]